MPRVVESVEIAGDRRRVYEMASDMESFPKFMPSVKSVTVLERDGNRTITDWNALLKGRPFLWKEEDFFDDENCHISYRLVEGDLKKFEGEWITEELPGGTRLTLTVEFEFGVPMLAALLNPIARIATRDNCRKMLSAIKAEIESGSQE